MSSSASVVLCPYLSFTLFLIDQQLSEGLAHAALHPDPAQGQATNQPGAPGEQESEPPASATSGDAATAGWHITLRISPLHRDEKSPQMRE